MKKLSTYGFFTLVIFCTLFELYACKKSNSTTPGSGTMNFTYKGTPHTIHEGNFSFSPGILTITLNDPGIFKGTIYFSTHCAYFAPTDSANNILLADNCQITSNFSPIDSAVIYLYQSGSLSGGSSNCHTETHTDILSGRTFTTTTCDIDGRFDLVLKNSENKTMTITDGTFHLNHN